MTRSRPQPETASRSGSPGRPRSVRGTSASAKRCSSRSRACSTAPTATTGTRRHCTSWRSSAATSSARCASTRSTRPGSGRATAWRSRAGPGSFGAGGTLVRFAVATAGELGGHLMIARIQAPIVPLFRFLGLGARGRAHRLPRRASPANDDPPVGSRAGLRRGDLRLGARNRRGSVGCGCPAPPGLADRPLTGARVRAARRTPHTGFQRNPSGAAPHGMGGACRCTSCPGAIPAPPPSVDSEIAHAPSAPARRPTHCDLANASSARCWPPWCWPRRRPARRARSR